MKNKTEHTPTPWNFDEFGKMRDSNDNTIRIAATYDDGSNGKANAEFIVRAVNSHETLLETIKYALKLAELELEEVRKSGENEDGMIIASIKNQINKYKQALKQAEVK